MTQPSADYSKPLALHIERLVDELACLERPAFGLHWFRGAGLREAPYMSNEHPESYARLREIDAELLPERLAAYEAQHQLFLSNRPDALNRYQVASLERRMNRFLTYIPERSELSHSYNSETGSHFFTNYEGYIERLILSKAEWQYLLAQHRLLG